VKRCFTNDERASCAKRALDRGGDQPAGSVKFVSPIRLMLGDAQYLIRRIQEKKLSL
jgi:hypothetical protein